jgi:hypothetical protein
VEKLIELLGWFMKEECPLILVHLGVSNENDKWVLRIRTEDTVGNREVWTNVNRSLTVCAASLLGSFKETE